MISSMMVFKWALVAHFVSCYVLTAVITGLGIRLRKLHTRRVRATLFVSVAFITAQFPVTVLRYTAVNNGVLPVEPLDEALLNFLWSPMLTPVLIWLYITHAVKSCYSCAISVPRKNVTTLPDLRVVGKYALAGIATTMLLYAAGILEDANTDTIMRLLVAIAMLGSSLEIIYIRAKFNVIRIASSTWAWFMGTLSGAIILSAL